MTNILISVFFAALGAATFFLPSGKKWVKNPFLLFYFLFILYAVLQWASVFEAPDIKQTIIGSKITYLLVFWTITAICVSLVSSENGFKNAFWPPILLVAIIIAGVTLKPEFTQKHLGISRAKDSTSLSKEKSDSLTSNSRFDYIDKAVTHRDKVIYRSSKLNDDQLVDGDYYLIKTKNSKKEFKVNACFWPEVKSTQKGDSVLIIYNDFDAGKILIRGDEKFINLSRKSKIKDIPIPKSSAYLDARPTIGADTAFTKEFMKPTLK